jgi:hypothetical protein
VYVAIENPFCHVDSEDLAAVDVLWDVMQFSLVGHRNILEGPASSVSRAEESIAWENKNIDIGD